MMQYKNIVRISGSYYPAKKMGGAATADFELDKALAVLGHSVSVLTTTAGLETDIKLQNVYQNVYVKYFKFYLKENFFISPFMLFYFLWKVFNNDFRRSHFMFSGTWGINSLLLMTLCRVLNLKYSITPHGSLYQEMIQTRKSKIKIHLINAFLKSALIKSKFIHFTVDSERNDAIQSLAGELALNAKVVPLGMNFKDLYLPDANKLAEFKLRFNIRDDTVKILFVGRINWKKGIDKLLLSLPANQSEKYQLICVGPEDDGFLELLKKKVGDDIFRLMHYIGPLYGNELACAYSVADIFALTSLSENFGMTIIEAAFYKNAILMSDQVGVSCFFDENSAVVTSLEQSDITAGLEKLLQDENLRVFLSKNASCLVQQFDIQKTASTISELVNQ